MNEVQQAFNEFRTSKANVPFEALAKLFDKLDPISNDEILGNWKGGYIRSGSLIDWTLKDYGFYAWTGKHYYSEDKVHALRHQLFGFKFNFPFIGTARIREINFCDKVSTGMIYNYLPIIDHFRRVDENTLMGAMDFKGKIVLYFYLYRD